jgi:hypothetical protein
VHNPAHRGGVAYANAAARARFDAARVSGLSASARSGAGREAAARTAGGQAAITVEILAGELRIYWLPACCSLRGALLSLVVFLGASSNERLMRWRLSSIAIDQDREIEAQRPCARWRSPGFAYCCGVAG